MKKSLFVMLLFFGMTSLNFAQDNIIRWTFQTGQAIYTTPLVHEGILYFGSQDSVFYAVNAQTGQELWQFKTDNPIQSNAAAFENGILFESGNTLYALDFQGNQLWTFPLYTDSITNQIDAWDFFHSSPNVVDGIAYIGTENGLIYGVDVQTGEEAFKVQTPGQGIIRVMPVIEGDKLYTGDWDGLVYCHDLNSGELIWQYDTQVDGTYAWTNAIQTSMMVYDGKLFFAGRSGLAYALNALTGEKLWTYSQAGVWVVGGPVIADGLVYYGSSNQSLLYALDIETGESQWNAGIDFRMWNNPLVSGDYLFFGAMNFYAMNRHTGEVVNRMPFKPEDVHTKPLHIWYWAGDSYEAADALSNFHSSAVQVDNLIIVGCDDGKVYAFDLDAFLSMPIAKTSLENEDIPLDDVPNNAIYTIEIPLINTGSKDDSVTISLGGASAIKKVSTLEQDTLTVPAGGTATIRIQIDPATLKTKSYTLTVMVNSQYNLNASRLMKSLQVNVVAVSEVEDRASKPASFKLESNFPNPFNPSTRIHYSISELATVNLNVYDASGRKVANLVCQQQQPGNHSVRFDASDLSTGVYLCVLEAGAQIATQKMMLLK